MSSKLVQWMAAGAAALFLSTTAHGQGKMDIPIEPMSVKMSHVPSSVYAMLYVAQERGYFKERGLDVELVIVRGGDTAFQVASGTLQFAGGSPDSAFFNAIERGLPLKTISSLAVGGARGSTTPLMVRKDLHDSGQITKVSDLKGQKLAFLVPGGIMEYMTARALNVGNLTLADVDGISPMGFRQMVDALTTKAVAAAVLAEPFAAMAIKAGTAVELSGTHDEKEQILFVKTNDEFAKKHPNVVANFLIAFLKGVRDLQGDQFLSDANVAILEKHTRVPPEITRAAAIPYLPPNGELAIDSVMAQQRYHMSQGKITYDTPKAPETFVDLTYLNKAVAFLGQYKN